MSYEILKNKNVFITGASSGLGREIAIDLSNHGCNLFLTGRNLDELFDTMMICNPKVKVFSQYGDLTRLTDRGLIILTCNQSFKNIDILINCAGHLELKTLLETSDNDFDRLMNINVKVPFQLIKEFTNGMIKRNWGRIVNIGSSSSYSGSPQSGMYSITKHALHGMTKSLMPLLKEHGIRMIDILPGSIKTPMGKQDLVQDYDTFIDPKEIAECISFMMKFDNEMIIPEMKLTRRCL